jgi:hypothetical protein
MRLIRRTPVHSASRSGLVLVVAALIMVAIFGLAAFAIDIGYISFAISQSQTCADASALAAAGELYPSPIPQTAIKLPIQLPIYRPYMPKSDTSTALLTAKQLSVMNRVAKCSQPSLLTDDIQFGVWDNGLVVGPPTTIGLVDQLLSALDLRTADNTFVNSISVTVRNDKTVNGALNLFFAPIMGFKTKGIKTTATAAVMRGYGVEQGDMLLPFAMDITIWNAIRFTNGEVNALDLSPLGVNLDTLALGNLLGQNPLLQLVNADSPYDLMGNPISVLDNFTWKRPMRTVTPGADKIWEVVLLGDQLQSVHSPGLLGSILTTVKRVPATFVTLDYRGNSANSPDATYTSGVLKQGLSTQDVAHTTTTNDGRVWLPFSAQGYFEIPSSCEADLKAIVGQTRIMPLYATLPGTVINKVTDVLGMQHQFQIVGWGAVVITKVNLSGPIRYINVQPAIYTRFSVHAALGTNRFRSQTNLSDGVYTSPKLVR